MLPQKEMPWLTSLEEFRQRYHLPLMPVIWAVTCVIISALIIIGLYSYYSAEKAIAHQFNSQQLNILKQTATNIENFLMEIKHDISLLTSLPRAQELSLENREEAMKFFLDTLHGKVEFFIFQDEKGAFLSYPAKKTISSAQGLLISPIYFEKLKKEKTPLIIEKREAASIAPAGLILIAAPIFSGKNFHGILAGGLNFEILKEKFLLSLPLGARGSSWLINQEGIILAHAQTKLLEAKNSSGGNQFQLMGERLSQLLSKEMVRHKAGMGEEVFTLPGEGKEKIKYLFAYAPIKVGENSWIIALVTPYSEMTQIVWASFKNSVFLLAIMVGTLLMGTYVGHKINQSRIRAEEKVKWSEEIVKTQNRLQILFDGSPDAIAIIDQDFRISMLNKTALNWYKKSLEDFLGKVCYQEFQGRSEPCPNCPAQETFKTGKTAYRDRASLVVEGVKKYLQLYTFPLPGQNGEVQEVVEYVKDVTAEKRLQQQIIQSERLAVVGKMSANVAHEIKNPLGTIVLNAELLEDELSRLGSGETEEARQLLGIIKSEVDHLLEVIEEYLQFARLPKLKLEAGNINEVVANLLFFLKEEASERNVLIQEELANILPPVQMDAKQLRQALLNIIKNSFEAMPEGGKLTVSTGYKDGRVEVTIADTGRGIPEENLDLIFTPFFSTKHGGTGLGLSITSHIIQEHQGSINVKSYVDLGTVFTISLPALATENQFSQEEERKDISNG
ncbi:MAG: sensor histidine kinase [Thermodesulfobacteriota bacterium]